MFPGIADLRHYPELDGKTFVICVGAMKCATSWVYDYLGGLPDTVVSPLKELHFFDIKFAANALGDMETLALRRLLWHGQQEGNLLENLRRRPSFQASVDAAQMLFDDNAYFAHFARLCEPETRCFCDVTPAYATLGPTGFKYLRAFCDAQRIRTRILFILRDPVDRLWSQLRQMTHAAPERDFVSNWQEAYDAPAIMARADYRGTMMDIEANFAPEDVLYLFYETLFEELSLRKLCDFVGAPYAKGDASAVKNRTQLMAEMPEDARAAALEILAPQYAYCRDRFGADLPDGWLR